MTLQDKLVNKLKVLYPDITKSELNKIIDSEFRLIEKVVKEKGVKVVNSVHLGKFYPTAFRRRLELKKQQQQNESTK